MNITNKTILITGANRGIGSAIAELLSRCGARILLCGRNMNQLHDVLLGLENQQLNHRIYFMDVTNKESVDAVFKELRTDKIIPDAVINNAGIMMDSTLQMVKQDLIDAVYSTNVFGTIYVTQQAIKLMVRKKSGSIINLSSIIGINGNLGQTVYGSSKSAIIGFTKSLSKELAPIGIRVNAIAPGFIDTEMTKSMDKKFYEKNLENIGMKRIGNAMDVAGVALFLVSDYSSYVTGQVIGVDGGMII